MKHCFQAIPGLTKISYPGFREYYNINNINVSNNIHIININVINIYIYGDARVIFNQLSVSALGLKGFKVFKVSRV